MAKHWSNDASEKFGGPVELTWNHAGQLQLVKATAKSKKDYVFAPDKLESILATAKASKLNADPEFFRLYGTERHEDGGAHKAISGDIPRPRVDGQGNRKENAYSGKMLKEFEHVELQLRVMYGKPSLWIFAEAPTAKKSSGNSKPRPEMSFKRIDV